MLYASSTLALACLEVVVHIRDVGLMPTDYVFCEIEVPKALISPWNFAGEASLAKIESQVLSREYGDAWFRDTVPQSRDELALLQSLPKEIQRFVSRSAPAMPVQTVPSIILPREMNYLMSPEHPQFGKLVWGEPQPFRFDPRLIPTAG